MWGLRVECSQNHPNPDGQLYCGMCGERIAVHPASSAVGPTPAADSSLNDERVGSSSPQRPTPNVPCAYCGNALTLNRDVDGPPRFNCWTCGRSPEYRGCAKCDWVGQVNSYLATFTCPNCGYESRGTTVHDIPWTDVLTTDRARMHGSRPEDPTPQRQTPRAAPTQTQRQLTAEEEQVLKYNRGCTWASGIFVAVALVGAVFQIAQWHSASSGGSTSSPGWLMLATPRCRYLGMASVAVQETARRTTCDAAGVTVEDTSAPTITGRSRSDLPVMPSASSDTHHACEKGWRCRSVRSAFCRIRQQDVQVPELRLQVVTRSAGPQASALEHWRSSQ